MWKRCGQPCRYKGEKQGHTPNITTEDGRGYQLYSEVDRHGMFVLLMHIFVYHVRYLSRHGNEEYPNQDVDGRHVDGMPGIVEGSRDDVEGVVSDAAEREELAVGTEPPDVPGAGHDKERDRRQPKQYHILYQSHD